MGTVNCTCGEIIIKKRCACAAFHVHQMCLFLQKKGRISSLLFLKVTSGDFAFRNLVGAHPVRTWKYVTNHKYCRAKHFTTDSRDQIGGSFWNRCVFSTRVKGDNRLPSGSPTSESPTWWAFLRWDFLSPSVIRKSRLKYYFLFELLQRYLAVGGHGVSLSMV